MRLLKWDTQNGAEKIISKQISSSYSAKKVKKRSKLYSIDLLADEDQVLYVGDRLKKANRTYSSYSVIQWYSVILLSKCDWASWAICCHENRAHGGRDASITNYQTVSFLMQPFTETVPSQICCSYYFIQDLKSLPSSPDNTCKHHLLVAFSQPLHTISPILHTILQQPSP